MGNTSLRVDEHFKTHIVSETLSDEGASMSKSCVIEGCEECEDDAIKELATKNDIESEVAMGEVMADGHVETFSTFVPETWVVAPESQRKTQEMEGGSKEAKIKVDPCDEDGSIIVERQAQHWPDRLNKLRTGSVGTNRLGPIG